MEVDQAAWRLTVQVVPKLNWSCPSDATWVNPLSSLACDNAEQVVLMLKSSDRVAHDLELLEAAAAAPTPGAAAPHDLGHAGQTHTAQGPSEQPVLYSGMTNTGWLTSHSFSLPDAAA
ncbi:uncharacterized protein HaLaN_17253 [Haematococcus lacustris]|uniref:Uncharacterized protein n=1 Tax=Haematococcus lacustris TaxID=44745 RepID=A0A699ZC02_HAELA|nr:uncharacterized protein HaLaN_17253 [Haematococcus lacustris]